MLFDLLSPYVLVRVLGLPFAVVAALLVRGLIRQRRVRREAQDMLCGKRAASEAGLDRCLREIGGAPGYARDEELLRQLAGLREEIRLIERRFSQSRGE